MWTASKFVLFPTVNKQDEDIACFEEYQVVLFATTALSCTRTSQALAESKTAMGLLFAAS